MQDALSIRHLNKGGWVNMKSKIVLTLLIFTLLSGTAYTYAADEGTTTISYRIKALQEKLSTMSQDNIEKSLGKFSDMGNHWSGKFVGRLTALEIIKGMPDGTFRPDDKVKVDEFIVMTVRALGFKPEFGGKYWAEPYIEIAKQEKLIDPSEFTDYTVPIRREQAARITVKASMLNETAPNSNTYDYIRGKIKDYPSIGDNYKQSVLEAYAIGLISGTPEGYFLPGNTLKRGEASTIIIKNLDTSLRTPLKPDAHEVLMLKDLQGKSYEVYPSSKPETFKTAVDLGKNISKSTGYAFITYNPFEQIISGSFYQSKNSYNQSDFNIQMGLSIHTLDDKSVEFPYEITVFNPEEVKALHRDVIVEVFKSLFENDAAKAISEFDRYLELSTKSGPATENTYNYNNRKVRFYTVENEKKLTVWIYNKEE